MLPTLPLCGVRIQMRTNRRNDEVMGLLLLSFSFFVCVIATAASQYERILSSTTHRLTNAAVGALNDLFRLWIHGNHASERLCERVGPVKLSHTHSWPATVDWARKSHTKCVNAPGDTGSLTGGQKQKYRCVFDELLLSGWNNFLDALLVQMPACARVCDSIVDSIS